MLVDFTRANVVAIIFIIKWINKSTNHTGSEFFGELNWTRYFFLNLIFFYQSGLKGKYLDFFQHFDKKY